MCMRKVDKYSIVKSLYKAIERADVEKVQRYISDARGISIVMETRLSNSRHPSRDVIPVALACEGYVKDPGHAEQFNQICQCLIDAGAGLGIEFNRMLSSDVGLQTPRGFLKGTGETLLMRYKDNLPPAVKQRMSEMEEEMKERYRFYKIGGADE